MDINTLIGKTLIEAEQICKDANIPFRVTSEDGVDYMVTCDFVPERINFTVISGIVTETNIG